MDLPALAVGIRRPSSQPGEPCGQGLRYDRPQRFSVYIKPASPVQTQPDQSRANHRPLTPAALLGELVSSGFRQDGAYSQVGEI